MLPFWEQLLIYQGLAALHAVISKYGTKLYSPEELAQLQGAADLVGQLPQRLHDSTVQPKPGV